MMDIKVTLPLLPLRDIVVFPSMVIPLFVGRDKSITALNEVMKGDKKIVLVTQKNSEVDDPKKNDVFTYGCESNILKFYNADAYFLWWPSITILAKDPQKSCGKIYRPI